LDLSLNACAWGSICGKKSCNDDKDGDDDDVDDGLRSDRHAQEETTRQFEHAIATTKAC